MKKTTTQDLLDRVYAVHHLCIHLGIIGPDTQTVLSHGSRSNGKAWRLYATPTGDACHHPHPAFDTGGGYLGRTKPEAARTLAVITNVLQRLNTWKRHSN